MAAVAVVTTIVVLATRSPGTDQDDRTAPVGPSTTTSAPAAGAPDDSQDGRQPGAAPPAAGGPDNDVVADSTQRALQGVAEALATPGTDTDLSTVASGAYLAALEAQVQEFTAQGWRQSGAPLVDSVTILSSDMSATPPTVTAQLCVDSSGVKVLDENGDDLRNEGTPARSLNILTLVEVDGVWLVDKQTFADEPDC